MRKPPILLLPGLLNDGRLWGAQLPALAWLTAVRVADLTGHDTISALAAAAIAQAPEGRFALVGFAMGGYVALEVVRQAPDRIAGLAMIDSSARPDTAQARKIREAAVALAQTNFDAVVDSFPPRVLHPAHLDDAAIVVLIKAMSLDAGKDTFGRQQRAVMDRIDSRPHLADIRFRTLVAGGREDSLTPVSVQEELAASIAGAQLAVIEQCGHMAPLEQPQEVTRLLVQWWQSVASDGPG